MCSFKEPYGLSNYDVRGLRLHLRVDCESLSIFSYGGTSKQFRTSLQSCSDGTNKSVVIRFSWLHVGTGTIFLKRRYDLKLVQDVRCLQQNLYQQTCKLKLYLYMYDSILVFPQWCKLFNAAASIPPPLSLSTTATRCKS